jgi:hypothetical protein
MAVFRIIRIYEIPATNRIEATDRMLEALELHTEEDYHVTDLVREHGEKPAQSYLLISDHLPNGGRFSSGKLPAKVSDCRSLQADRGGSANHAAEELNSNDNHTRPPGVCAATGRQRLPLHILVSRV